jgi:hypothetical protein
MADDLSGAPESGADDGFDFDGIEGFEMRDGSLQPYGRDPEESDETPEPAAKPEPEPKPEPAAAPVHDFEKRYNDLRPHADRVAAENRTLREQLAYLTGHVEAGKKPEREREPEAEEIDYLSLMTDPRRADQHFQSLVDREVSKRMESYEPLFLDMRLGNELRETIGKFPDFLEHQEAMGKVYEMFPGQDITFEQAYHIAKKFGLSGTPAPSPAPTPAPTPKVDAAAIRERAKRVNAETGVGGSTGVEETAKPKVGSVQDAFEQAWRGARAR